MASRRSTAFCPSRSVFAQHRALRIEAHPTDASALENVREHSLFIDLPGSAFMVQHVGPVRDRNLAQLAHGNHALVKVQGLVFSPQSGRPTADSAW